MLLVTFNRPPTLPHHHPKSTVLSLLLCVGTCVLWVRSYWAGMYASYSFDQDPQDVVTVAFASDDRGISLGRFWTDFPLPFKESRSLWDAVRQDLPIAQHY